MKPTRSELIQQYIDSFPVLPVTVTRLMDVTNDPECSVKDVVETIHSDPSLCLTILKISNSVLFGRPQKVDSIKMAVVILGFNEVQRIAMAKAFINSFSKISQKHKPFVDRFWEHSFVCGLAARGIALDLHIAPDIAFMGGLIHDIGKLIMLETFADDYGPERWMTELSIEETLHEELEMYSFTHDMVGGQLLKKWLFPENLITAVAYHHRPDEAVKEKAFAHVIQLADILSFYCCNQKLLWEEDILTFIHTSLPDIQSHWQSFGIPLKDDAIVGWFDWLATNHKQGSRLNDAFSA
ncbi:MAG: HDOD domain-containing protein [Desulfobulbaceae bacterium]|nr:HDOD domain-containing protein [Desulfobulbaceae bacterium]